MAQYFFRYLLYFIVAYAPLFLILLLQAGSALLERENFVAAVAAVLLIIVILGSLILFIFIFNESQKQTKKPVVIVEIKNITGDALTYVIPYIIGFIGFSFTPIDTVSLVIILIVIFLIYTNSDLLAINPTLHILQYKTYLAKTNDGGTIFIITKNKNIMLNRRIEIYLLTDKIYLLSEVKSEAE